MSSERSASIVVGIDGSANSRRALEWAIGEARRTGGDVRAVLVWDDPWALVGPPSPISAAGPELPRLRQVLEVIVRDATAAAPGPAVTVRPEVHSGHPAEVLTKLAADAAMLVVGSRGRSGLSEALLGSVSHRCAQLSAVPVVIVPAPAAA